MTGGGMEFLAFILGVSG